MDWRVFKRKFKYLSKKNDFLNIILYNTNLILLLLVVGTYWQINS